MAVTFIQQPTSQSIQSSDNPLTFVFSSNQSTQPNFCFIVETLINGLVVSTDKVFPERGNRAHWDASRIAMTAVKYSPRSPQMLTQRSLPTLNVRVAERYGTTPTTQPFYYSNTILIMKARCSDEKYQLDWITDTYTAEYKWLTDCPDQTFIVSNKHPFYASILVTSPQLQLDVFCYDAQGNQLGSITEQETTTGEVVDIKITPQDIATAISPASIEDVARLEVYVNQSLPLVVQYIPAECTEYHQVNWLNNLGTYDQFLFGHNKDQESAISALEYKKQFGAWDANNSFQFDPLLSGDTVYLKTIQPTGTVYTGWISQAYQHWLAQIYYSISTLLLDQNTTEAIVVTQTQSSEMKSRFDELLNFQVSYKKSNFKSITQ